MNYQEFVGSVTGFLREALPCGTELNSRIISPQFFPISSVWLFTHKKEPKPAESRILYRDEQPGIKNLIDIYCACTGKTPDEASGTVNTSP